MLRNPSESTGGGCDQSHYANFLVWTYAKSLLRMEGVTATEKDEHGGSRQLATRETTSRVRAPIVASLKIGRGARAYLGQNQGWPSFGE